MNCKTAIEKLYALPRFNRGNTLEPVHALLRALHDPQKALCFVHVAGTNGKGSICTMVASILESAGYRVGLYTSPYINHFRERFRISGEPVQEAAFAAASTKVFAAMQKLPADNGLSQFDVITAIAFVLYAEAACDMVILECGLGGRLDATNTIPPPKIAVIGNIGYDHMTLLGNTISKIATEKCGIIKPGTGAVICAPQDYPEATRVVESYAAGAGVPYLSVDADDITIVQCTLGTLTLTYKEKEYRSSLSAAYQAKNAGTAIEVALSLREAGMAIPDAAIKRGLSHAFIPARLELISMFPHILLDGAHNRDGLCALRDSILHIAPHFDRLFCLVGMLQDKAPGEALSLFFSDPIIKEKLANVMTVTPTSPRACSAEDLAEEIRKIVPVGVVSCPDSKEAVGRVISGMQGKDLLLCFGSLYMMGDIRKTIEKRYLNRRRYP